MSELKPCPFCGADAEVIESKVGQGWRVKCTNLMCEAMPGTRHRDSMEQAARDWNQRHERTCRDIGVWMRFKCSECGCSVRMTLVPNYCPACGAKVV